MKRRYGIRIGLLLGLALLHRLALGALDRADLVGRALAFSEHDGLGVALALATFLLLRLVVVLVLPGLLIFTLADAYRAVRETWRIRAEGRVDPG